MKTAWLGAACLLVVLSGCSSDSEQGASSNSPNKTLEQTLTSVDGSVSMPLVGNWIIEQEDPETMAAVLDEEEGGKLWLTVYREPLVGKLEDFLENLDESNTPLIQRTDTGYPYVSFVPQDEKNQDWQTSYSYVCNLEGTTVVIAEIQYYRNRDWLIGKPGSEIWSRVNKSINSVRFH